MAHVHQSLDRGDDAVRRGVRRDVSAAASGPAVGFLLAVSVSRHDGTLAAISQSAGLGRVCRQHLFHRLADFLVCRPDSRSGHVARPRANALQKNYLWHSGAGLARFGEALATIIKRPICCWPDWPRRWCSPCIAWSVLILPSRWCPAGTRPFSRRILSPARFIPALRWC